VQVAERFGSGTGGVVSEQVRACRDCWWTDRLRARLAAGSAAAFAGGLGAAQGANDHGHGTAHTVIDGDGIRGAILCTGSAFHAGVAVYDEGAFVFHLKNGVRADLSAAGATDALVRVQLERHHIFKIAYHGLIHSRFVVPAKGA
jgi:hypothetical protein